ncbi:MAG: tRNA (guanine-N(1)-)-methyltransferase [Alphaproteobacteria bacterium MarineAlpha9_Bin7]|nr:MAG: tRNA (guanine-N(1)-)-methyltransferase [Alphaproteobacteria bacterium MarineAlpha9_Bin7]
MTYSKPWTAHVLTLFPNLFPGPLGHSLAGTALERGLWSLKTVDIRNFARDKHGAVDDAPYGGGPGMVLRPDVAAAAIDSALDDGGHSDRDLARICLTPRGLPVTQSRIQRWAAGAGVIVLCGRFEGIDQRVIEARAMEEVSVGDFVMSSGEPAAIALIDGCIRLLPGVVGNPDAVVEESFEHELLEYPHFTRPQLWQGKEVPAALMSGDHEWIKTWRRREAERVTQERRPDMWQRYRLLNDRTN